MGRFTFVFHRLLQLVPVAVGVTIISFFLIRLVPGDPVVAMLGIHYTKSGAEHLRHALGFDRSIWQQYIIYIGNLLHGNLGTSVYYGQSVLSLIVDRIEPTLWLVLYACVLSAVMAVPLAIVSALNRDRALDQIIRGTFVLALAMPNFWVGIMLLLLLSVEVRLFPVTGFGDTFVSHLWHLFLPALTVALGFGTVLIRSLRNSILTVMRTDYIRTARAKGMSRTRMMVRHVLRNAALPTVTIFGINIAFLIGGTVIIENVFSLGGIGQLLLSSIEGRDYPVVQGITLLLAMFVIMVNLFVDIVYALLDPRISYE